MAAVQEELEQEKDRYLRLFAEFENYKRRTSKERMELFKTASQDVMVAMLPVLDDFDRALKEIEKAEDDLSITMDHANAQDHAAVMAQNNQTIEEAI